MNNELLAFILQNTAVAGTFLSVALLLIPRALSENIKKAIVFVVCLAYAGYTGYKSGLMDISQGDISIWVSYILAILTAASQSYENLWKSLSNSVGQKTGIKFLQRDSSK